MSVPLLIGAIVRQTTVLIAQLATTGGVRAPLEQLADQVFKDLVGELERQGVSRKVSADMFGMSLRSYLRRIQQLGESSTERGRSLWEAMLDHLQRSGPLTRAEVLARFHRDDDALVRGILHDLTESGLVFATGTAADSVYRAASNEELGVLRRARRGEGLDDLIWAIVYRDGPIGRDALLALGGVSGADLDAALGRLLGVGRVEIGERNGGAHYAATGFFVPRGSAAGFEAALFDHFQALVKTVCGRLRGEAPSLSPPEGVSVEDLTGGSTYTFDLWPGHPLAPRVLGMLAEYRRRTSALRTEVEAHNERVGLPHRYVKVTSYAGQCLVEYDEENGA